jgi:hypothetical protein
MRLHMHGLRLWDFLIGKLPCLPSHSAPAQPVISEKTTAPEKEKLLTDYEDHLASYETQFTRAGLGLMSMLVLARF